MLWVVVVPAVFDAGAGVALDVEAVLDAVAGVLVLIARVITRCL